MPFVAIGKVGQLPRSGYAFGRSDLCCLTQDVSRMCLCSISVFRHCTVFKLSPIHWPQNTWPWITLNGHFTWNSVFAQVCSEFLCGFCGNNCVENNKRRPTLSAAKMFSMNSSFWWYKVYVDIRGGSQDLCKFFLDLRMPVSIYTGTVCRTRCQDHVVRWSDWLSCQSTELFLELDEWT